MTDICVIIPTYNRAHRVTHALDSVLSQTHPPAQIIVVDDGSTDDTRLALSPYMDNIEYVYQANKGVSAARNQGIKKAHTQWVAFLDSDDTWHPTKLEKQLHAANLSECRLIHCDEIWIRRGVRVNPMRKHQKFGGHIFEKCLPLCCISPSAVMIKTEVFKETGYFDENMPACEDYDFWLRFCATYPVSYIDEPLLTKHGGHDDQLSSTYPAMDRFRIYALKKLISSQKLTQEQIQAVISTAVKKIDIFCKGAAKRNKQQELSEYQHLRHWFIGKQPTQEVSFH